jgi:hypothetical protein
MFRPNFVATFWKVLHEGYIIKSLKLSYKCKIYMKKCETECVHNTATFILILAEGGVYFKQPRIVDKHIRLKNI